MKYSQATHYALHTMLYLVALPTENKIAVHQLAQLQQLSPTYLSKILAKLVKAGLIESTPGIKGGYRLLKSRSDVSFLDVIHAIEGTASLFQCETTNAHQGCLIQKVMTEAEEQMETFLSGQKLVDLADQLQSSPFYEKMIHAFVSD
ncbi:MAG: Rrf2 family transcriptional regulator [Chloroflexota bacterium]